MHPTRLRADAPLPHPDARGWRRGTFTLVPAVVAAWLFALPVPARADLYVIVHGDNPVAQMTRREVLELFMGRRREFGNGQPAVAVDLPKGSATRTAFYTLLTGQSEAQISSYWARLMFSGQVMPPEAMPDEAGVVEFVAQTPRAIGYVTTPPTRSRVKTVYEIRQ